MKRRNIAIMAMLALTAGQAFAQRCLPQMKCIEVKVGMADGVYNGKNPARLAIMQVSDFQAIPRVVTSGRMGRNICKYISLTVKLPFQWHK